MKHVVLLLLCVFAIPVQAESGIKFENDLSWKQLLAKAKAENKYIFVDCYTTWCGPCKAMEEQIYPLEQVGKFYNAKFVSIKLQMDKTPKDAEAVRNRYADADELKSKYAVDAFPTYLFFAPDGKPVHRVAGGRDAEQFIGVARDALDPQKQYYTLLANYAPGKLSPGEIKERARSFNKYGGKELADKMASDYIARIGVHAAYDKDDLLFMQQFKKNERVMETAGKYLQQLKETDLYTKENLEFLIAFTRTPKDFGFPVLYRNGAKVNAVLDMEGYAQSVAAGVIYANEVAPLIKTAKQEGVAPNWTQIQTLVADKYDAESAHRIVLNTQMNWYQDNKDWKHWGDTLIQFMDEYGEHMGAFNLNNTAWSVFLNSSDKSHLLAALSWSERAVKAEPYANWMDTYANILYKLGRRDEAMRWQQTAAQLAPKDESIQENLKKMQQGQSTWPT